MKGIAVRCRKIFRLVFRAVSVSAASLILQACYGPLPPEYPSEYGMPPPEIINEITIRGKVLSKKTGEPIFGINVSIEGTDFKKHTDEDGYFYFFWMPLQDVYKIKFEDLDGPYNGGLFLEQTLTIKQNDTQNTIQVWMDEDTETDGE